MSPFDSPELLGDFLTGDALATLLPDGTTIPLVECRYVAAISSAHSPSALAAVLSELADALEADVTPPLRLAAFIPVVPAIVASLFSPYPELPAAAAAVLRALCADDAAIGAVFDAGGAHTLLALLDAATPLPAALNCARALLVQCFLDGGVGDIDSLEAHAAAAADDAAASAAPGEPPSLEAGAVAAVARAVVDGTTRAATAGADAEGEDDCDVTMIPLGGSVHAEASNGVRALPSATPLRVLAMLLGKLSDIAAIRPALARAGGVAAAVALLRSFAAGERVDGALVLLNLLCDNGIEFVVCDGVAPLAAMLASDVPEELAPALALSNRLLALRGDAAAVAVQLLSAGAAAAAARVLRLHTPLPASTLCSAAAAAQTEAVEGVHAGALCLIAGLLSRAPQAYRHLVVDAGVAAGVAEQLHSPHPILGALAAGVLWMLCDAGGADDCKGAVLRCGGVSALVALMRGGTVAARSNAVGALRALECFDETSDAFGTSSLWAASAPQLDVTGARNLPWPCGALV